jgi:hypothetical protein
MHLGVWLTAAAPALALCLPMRLVAAFTKLNVKISADYLVATCHQQTSSQV